MKKFQVSSFKFQGLHKPVLLKEALEYLNPRPGGVFIDATINGGGHASAIAERIGKNGKLLGIDRDSALIEHLKVSGSSPRLSESGAGKFQVSEFRLVCDTFANIQAIAEKHHFIHTDGILFDLGFSSFHIESSGRGFSFLRDEPLDMRYDSSSGISAKDIVNTWPEDKLQELLFTFGEERYARRIVRRIVEARERRRVETTGQLVEILRQAVPAVYRRGKIHFATKTFQALRISVNDELEHVARGIMGAIALLAPKGRVAVISFHSGEDRVVKELFRQQEQKGMFRRVTKKPIRSSWEECRENPRARSAKLRVGERII